MLHLNTAGSYKLHLKVATCFGWPSTHHQAESKEHAEGNIYG